MKIELNENATRAIVYALFITFMLTVVVGIGIVAINTHRNHCNQCQGAHPEEVIKP